MEIKSLFFAYLFLTSFTVSADETIYKWTGANDEFCTAISPSGIAEKADLKKCLLKAPIKYAWSDDSQKKCAAYTPNNIFVAFTEESNCKEGVKLECSPTLDTPESKLRTMIDGVLLKIIPEIIALKDGETIPRNILEGKDSRLIAASIIERLSQKDNKNVQEENEDLYDFYNDSEIQMAFHDKNFEKIRNNCFRNQYQTNTTNGTDTRKNRQSTEKELVGLSIDANRDILETPNDISHHLRPKYAFFVPTKPMNKALGNSYAFQYGNIYAVLKDEAKDRSTFTPRDSLGMTKTAEPVNSKKDYKISRVDGYGYWEAQIWGNVCFQDVAHFLINCPLSQVESTPGFTPKKNNISDEVIAKMKETGIPVYQCKLEQKGINKVYTKGEPLFVEDSKKRKIDEKKANPNSNFPERREDPDFTFKQKLEEFLKDTKSLLAMAERVAHENSTEGMTKEEVKDEYLAKAIAFKENPSDPKALKDFQDAHRSHVLKIAGY